MGLRPDDDGILCNGLQSPCPFRLCTTNCTYMRSARNACICGIAKFPTFARSVVGVCIEKTNNLKRSVKLKFQFDIW